MQAELTEAARRCDTCQEAQPSQPKEPLMTYPLPANPWQVVFSDYFEHANQHHCIFVDSYSDYIEVVELEDLTAATLINKTKQVFATHGIPVTFIM